MLNCITLTTCVSFIFPSLAGMLTLSYSASVDVATLLCSCPKKLVIFVMLFSLAIVYTSYIGMFSMIPVLVVRNRII